MKTYYLFAVIVNWNEGELETDSYEDIIHATSPQEAWTHFWEELQAISPRLMMEDLDIISGCEVTDGTPASVRLLTEDELHDMRH